MNNTNSSLAIALLSAGFTGSDDGGETVTEITADSGYQGAEVTTMNTTTETTQATETAAPASATKAAKPKKEKAAPRNYPFLTKAQISAKIEADFGFACQVIEILYDRQTKHEQDTKSTLNKNRRGFMSSHAVHGSRIAQLLLGGTAPEALADEDSARVMQIAPRYTKQLAEHFRAAAIEADPSLKEQASCFFTDQ